MPEQLTDSRIRRQLQCENCDGRAWLQENPDISSQCYNCGRPGELVPEGQEIELHQFRCGNCDGQAWYKRAERSRCIDCGQYGEKVPAGKEIKYSQFVCRNAKCPRNGLHRWEKMAEESKCRFCGEYGEMVPSGEEQGVFICKFSCDCDCVCGNSYTVRCQMSDTAVCYECLDYRDHRHEVSPYAFLPLRFGIKRTTNKVHSCSSCYDTPGNCPNFRNTLSDPD